MRELRATPTGRLRIQMLPGFALGHFGAALAEFADRTAFVPCATPLLLRAFVSGQSRHAAARDATLVGHSIGGGEIARYVSRHGSGRVAKVILVGSVAPTTAGVPKEIFDGIRKALADNRGQFFKDLAGPFLGINRPNASVPQGTVDAFWLQGMSGGILGQIDCIRAFSEVDYTGDMKRISVPTLILHGDDDQNVPIEISAQQSVKLIPNATLKVYPGGSHGIVMTHVHEINADILGFLKT
ncbi:alpha/beta fold hydrolase [Cupriavidus sp. D39]|uniref:alpha/beta fold hydrolase n=1 Tax=Cupriavidus sp. D39 TaxID=2997877 RepID=UPI0022701908|nr:alpha/beta hydrolase [Cupriavidus sp. D39]MCY0855417.1 alpha/beta hydrolase [Cupriavidus sp. D39]